MPRSDVCTKMWYIEKQQNAILVYKNKILLFAVTCKNIEGILYRTQCFILLMWYTVDI